MHYGLFYLIVGIVIHGVVLLWKGYDRIITHWRSEDIICET